MNVKKHVLIISTMIILSLAIILFSVWTRYRNPSPSAKMSASSSLYIEETYISTQSSEPNFPVTAAENTEVKTVDEDESNKIMSESEFPSAQGSLSSDNAIFMDNANSYEQNEIESVAQERVTMNEDNNTFEVNNTLTQSELLERIILEYANPNTSSKRRRELLELDEAITRHVRAPSTSGIRTIGARVHQSQ